MSSLSQRELLGVEPRGDAARAYAVGDVQSLGDVHSPGAVDPTFATSGAATATVTPSPRSEDAAAALGRGVVLAPLTSSGNRSGPPPLATLAASKSGWATSRHVVRMAGRAAAARPAEEVAALQTEKLIKISDLPPGMRAAVREFDDGDGQLSIFELSTSLRALERARGTNVRLRKYLCGAAVAVALLLVAICGLTFVSVKLAADTSVDGGNVVRVKGTGEPARMASAEMSVNGDGTLVTRPALGHNGHEIKPLATRSTHMQRALSSTMPDKYFKQLEFFEISNDFGSSLAVRVHAVVRVPRRDSHCGSVLILVTHLGRITLDGEDMGFDDDVGAVFAEAGFGISNNDNGPSYRRRLAEGAAVVGLFNFVAGQEEEWSCPNVPAPDMPADYTMTMITWKPCRYIEDCSYDQHDGSFLLYPGATVQPDETLATVVRETMHVKGGSRMVKVTEYPSRPFQVHVVDIDFATGEKREFDAVFDDTSRIYRCNNDNMPAGLPTGDLLANANFQYVGEGDDNTRNFKISYKIEVDGEKDYHHIHFYDDLITHTPRRIVHDDGTQSQITSFTEGFGVPEFTFTEDQLEACLEETAEFANNRPLNSFEDVRPAPASAYSPPDITPFWNNELARRGLAAEHMFEYGHSVELSRYLYSNANGTTKLWTPSHTNNLRQLKEEGLKLYFNMNDKSMSLTAAGGPFSVQAYLKWDSSGFTHAGASGEGCFIKVLCAKGSIEWERGSGAKGYVQSSMPACAPRSVAHAEGGVRLLLL